MAICIGRCCGGLIDFAIYTDTHTMPYFGTKWVLCDLPGWKPGPIFSFYPGCYTPSETSNFVTF